MPTIVWASDLHLDHATDAARAALAQGLRDLPGQTLILAGDISVAARLAADLEFIADAAARPLYFVLGNHDHYGSTVAKVRDAVTALAARRPGIQWLPPAGVVMLDGETALVGVDGWADGRHGDPLTTPLVLNDDRLIGELAAQRTRAARLAVKRALADADAARLVTLLDRATATARRILVATHVPPFPEALPHYGRLAAPEWMPLLVCEATGAVLKGRATAHPGHEFLVLSGHTHVAADVMVLPNLRCRVAAARYGEPGVQQLSAPM
ncbi:MAG: metallophosphoesterase family protein [Gemmatimonadales bacterium]